ncbi:hypothetical protein TNCV_891781 [Trichonephila clavipes]|nr:hypothetical protein TNCV_891781 [Trichonephila clavipes]
MCLLLHNSEKANGSSLTSPIPPNRYHDDRIASWEKKGEPGPKVTCVISVKKWDEIAHFSDWSTCPSS